jgi:hypothetical protein
MRAGEYIKGGGYFYCGGVAGYDGLVVGGETQFGEVGREGGGGGERGGAGARHGSGCESDGSKTRSCCQEEDFRFFRATSSNSLQRYSDVSLSYITFSIFLASGKNRASVPLGTEQVLVQDSNETGTPESPANVMLCCGDARAGVSGVALLGCYHKY